MHEWKYIKHVMLMLVILLMGFHSSILSAQVKKALKPKSEPTVSKPAEPKEDTPIITPIRISPNSNRFISDAEGNIFLVHKDILYEMVTSRGDVWSKISDKISCMAIDPKNKNIFYAIDTGGLVQKSLDRGRNWLSINNGLPSSSFGIVINPQNTQEVFALTRFGLFKTPDAGFSWSQLSSRSIAQLLIDPDNKDTYYAVTNEGLELSKDAGKNWNSINSALPKKMVRKGRIAEELPISVRAIALSHLPKAIIAATEESGFLKSEDQGKTWMTFNDGFKRTDGIYSIISNDSGIFIGSNDCIYYLADNDKHWNKIEIPKPEMAGLSISQVSGIHLLKSDGGYILTDNTGKIVFGDKTSKQIGLNYGVLPHSEILNIKNAPEQNRLYVSIKNKNYSDIDKYGLYYSSDHGQTWNVSYLYEAYVEQPRLYFHPTNANEMWLFDNHDTTDVYITSDRGGKWNKLDNTNFRFAAINSAFQCFAFDLADPNVKYICDWDKLFRYDSRTGNKLDLKIETRNFMAAQDDPNKLLAGLNLSLDKGWTWKKIDLERVWKDTNSSDVQITPIYFKSEYIILSVSRGSAWHHDSFLLASKDLGNSWDVLNLADDSVKGKSEDGEFYLVYLNPLDPNNIFIGYREKSEKHNGDIIITQSTDRGATWKELCKYKTAGLEAFDIKLTMEVVKEPKGRAIYLGTNYGLYRTRDEGISWELLGGINALMPKDDLKVVVP
jgi:photosystem II stability/assembly factor-like uncharacterized protein